jgi:endogenous inhibitor of DNA gyrase (YacG/DUF329 family)
MGTVASMRPRGKGGCPICGKAVVDRHKPFCSTRCAQIDLGRWLDGSYAIPGEPAAADEPPAADAGQEDER